MAEDLKPGKSLLDQSQMGMFTAGNRPYLGDPKVVGKVLRDMVEVFMEETGEDRAEAVTGAIRTAAEILTGQDDGYAPMGKWNTGDGIGSWIRGHMNKVPAEGGSYAAVEFALAHLVLHFMDAYKGMELGTETAEQAGTRLARMMRNWTTLMLGIPSGLAEEPTTQAPKG